VPTVSIITPCYNSAAFIGRTMESVCRQSYADWELVIVDDGSTDRSAEVIEALLPKEPRFRLVRQPNGGVAKARNNGFRACSAASRYLLFLDADDLLEPGMLETLTSYLEPEVHAHASMAFCDFARIDEVGYLLVDANGGHGPHTRYVPWGVGARRLPRSVANTPFVSIFALAVIIPSVTLIRRSAFEQAGGWDEAFGHVFEDTDLFLRLALQGEAHFVAERLVRHRRHTQNSTADVVRVNAQMARLYAKWLNHPQLTPDQHALVRRCWWFINGRLGPLCGLQAGARRLRRGDLRGAAHFWAGAARRYALSFVGWCPPAPGLNG
jgi:glycosyltransferase involved in cell wall biosynthesis